MGIAQWVAAEGSRERDPVELSLAEESFLDTLGCILAGAQERGPALLRELCAHASGQSWLIGTPGRHPAQATAQVNATAAHALDYDDYDTTGFTHPSSVLVPVALAVGQELRCTGIQALRAYLVGYEVTQTIGRALSPSDYLAGFHTAGTTATFGAVAAASYLMALDLERTATALGIAASLASGVRVNFGTDVKPLHAGHAARNGILAAQLAQRGFTASPSALEGECGYARTHSPAEAWRLTDEVHRLHSGQVGITRDRPIRKRFAACGATHSAISAALLVRGSPARPGQIRKVLVEGAAQYASVLVHHRPRTGLEAKFSMEGAVAIALLDGRASRSEFTDESVARSAVQDLAARVEVKWSDAYTRMWQDREALPASVTVSGPGWSDHAEVIYAPGSRQNPLTPDALTEKFTECALAVLGEQGTVKSAQAIRTMRSAIDLSTLGALLQPH